MGLWCKVCINPLTAQDNGMNPKKLAFDIYFQGGRLLALEKQDTTGSIHDVAVELRKIADKLLELPEVDDDT